MNILLLTFHYGCSNSIRYYLNNFYNNYNLEVIFIYEKYKDLLPEASHYNDLYLMDSYKAKKIWERKSNYFNKFDLIITSDTTPLSRIFLENDFKKKLIVWVCNRFDFSTHTNITMKSNFPDKDYYNLIKNSLLKKNIKIVFYSLFDCIYMSRKLKININPTILEPIIDVNEFKNIIIKNNYNFDFNYNNFINNINCIPKDINKKNTFLVLKYFTTDKKWCNLLNYLEKYNINYYRGKFAGPYDMDNFKGIIHIPHQWSTLTFYEALSLGIIYFIPSIKFYRVLAKNKFNPLLISHGNNINYLWEDMYLSMQWDSNIVVHFDSFEDLIYKINNIDYDEQKKKINLYFKNIKQKNKYILQNILNNY